MVIDQALAQVHGLVAEKSKLRRPSTFEGGPRHQDHAKMNVRILGDAMVVQRRNDQKDVNRARAKVEHEWNCRNSTLAKCEDETHIPKVEDLESSRTPECLEFDNRGQNTSHWGVLGVIEKVLKFRCPKCPRIGHLDICSPSYGKKKGRESNWQFDSLGNRPLPNIRIWSATWH